MSLRLRGRDRATYGCKLRAGLDCEAADPAHPGVAPKRRFNELGLLPGHSVVSAELNFADTSVAGIGDAGDVVLTGRNSRAGQGNVDARHGLHDGVLAPFALAVPVDNLAVHRSQA